MEINSLIDVAKFEGFEITNQPGKHIRISKDNNIILSVFFNEAGQIHGNVIMNDKSYIFESGKLKSLA